MNELTGLRWGVLPLETQNWLLEGANCIDGATGNNVTEGECIVDLTEELSIDGYVEDGNLIIKDESIIYNPAKGIEEEKEFNYFMINEVMTASEAAKKWGITEAAIRYSIRTHKLILGVDYRKAGGTTLVTISAMEKLYGEEKYLKYDS